MKICSSKDVIRLILSPHFRLALTSKRDEAPPVFAHQFRPTFRLSIVYYDQNIASQVSSEKKKISQQTTENGLHKIIKFPAKTTSWQP